MVVVEVVVVCKDMTALVILLVASFNVLTFAGHFVDILILPRRRVFRVAVLSWQ